MPTTIKNPPIPNRRVAVLINDDQSMFEFGCVAEIFGLKRPEVGPDWYRFETVSLDGLPVATQFGGRLVPDAGLPRLRSAGTIVIPCWKIDKPVPAELCAALRSAHRKGARLLSICSGVFVLAAAGLLDGQRATTHWLHANALRAQFPAIDVDPDVLYVDNGQVLSSAGSAAGLDLMLHLIRRDYGARIANLVARRLVISPQREGGQAQFVQQPVALRQRNRLSPLMERMRKSLDMPHPLPQLAAQANMSERSFLRHFKAATGTTPKEWLSGQRLQRARELLETTGMPINAVAEKSGFGTAMTLRHHFRQKLDTSPVAYRRRFGTAA